MNQVENLRLSNARQEQVIQLTLDIKYTFSPNDLFVVCKDVFYVIKV
jgi:hypothetical protein